MLICSSCRIAYLEHGWTGFRLALTVAEGVASSDYPGGLGLADARVSVRGNAAWKKIAMSEPVNAPEARKSAHSFCHFICKV